MKITSVEKNKSNKGNKGNKNNKSRLSVYIDDKFSFTISEDDFVTMNLYDNSVITEDTIDYIKNTLNFREAKALAVKYLSRKLRTEKEVFVKLDDEGYESSCIDKVIDELKAIGYINNKLYAQKYVFDRSKLKPLSKKMLKLELQTRGIQEDIIDEVLDDWKADDHIIAKNLLKRKFGKYDLTDEKVLKKAYAFLLHRGFSYDTIRDALRGINGNA